MPAAHGASQVGMSTSTEAAEKMMMPDREDLSYEEEILRNPYSLKAWTRYLSNRKDMASRRRYIIYERALKALPGSYKLWYSYLRERRANLEGLLIDHEDYRALNNAFERALVTMSRMPRIWLEYISHLTSQGLITRTRRVCDRALRSLPITQHNRIWNEYLGAVKEESCPVETAIRVWKRYLQLEASDVEGYIAYLKERGCSKECAQQLVKILNDEDFKSREGKTRHQLWLELCDLITKNPDDMKGLKVEDIIRGGIRMFTDEVGRLWVSLASYYIRRGNFERARDIYEEGIETVKTVRDFSIIFDAYTQLEESLIAAQMENLEDDEEVGADEADPDEDWKVEDDENDLDMRLARLEYLTERRPILISSVKLRQNPHNVYEWLKRANLFEGDPHKQIMTYTEAVKTVDYLQAVGKPNMIWVAFAKFYEKHDDLENARSIFRKATQQNFKSVEDLASIWCEWVEMELAHKNYKRALALCKEALQSKQYGMLNSYEDIPVQYRLHKSKRLWTLLIDLEESLGTIESTKQAYDSMLTNKVATPQIIINYALFLEENKFFEDAFRVYERGIALFKWPHVKEIWATYLKKFVGRYKGTKLERARDLFEQALDNAPEDARKALYLQYAKLEEDFGLTRRAMAVYERASKAVPPDDKMSVYELYISKAAEYYGVTKTREIYEEAINEGLPAENVKTMCLRYAKLEKKIGEIDRARAIMVHGAQLADPRADAKYWDEWNQFEIEHGNEDTFRDMLRVKRSVIAVFSNTHFNTEVLRQATQDSLNSVNQAINKVGSASVDASMGDNMKALEQQASEVQQVKNLGGDAPMFVSGGTVGSAPESSATNKEEIDIDSENPSKMEVAQQSVPEGVFGSLKRSLEAPGGEGESTLERMKKARQE